MEKQLPAGTTRAPQGNSAVSLLLVIHLFFLATALASSYGRSELTGRILQRFGFYTQFLNLELNLNFAPIYLTHALETDVDHEIEMRMTEEGEWTPLPASGGFGERARRYRRLGRYLGLLAEDDTKAARLAAAVAEHCVRAHEITPQQIRCRRHLLQDWEVLDSGTAEERNPDSEIYYRVPYAANCVVSSGGRVDVMKVETTSQVALPGAASEQ